MGPTSKTLDQGAKMIASLGSVLGLEGEELMSEDEVRTMVDQVKDPVGTFYMFTLPASILKRKTMTQK